MAAPVKETDQLVDLGVCGWCQHVQWSHKRGKAGCKELDCPCGKYEPPKGRPAPPANDWPLPAAEVEQAEAAGLVVRPESPAADPGLDAALTELEPVDEPEPDPAPVVADPVAQAEHAVQVAAIDAQLADREPTCAYPNGEDQGEHDHAMCEDVVAERAEAWTLDARFAGPHLHRPAASVAEPHQELARLTAELEQVRAEKVRLAGQLAPRLADLDRALGEVSKLRNVNVELGRTRSEVDRLQRENRELRTALTRAEGDRDVAQSALRKTAEAYVHTSIAAATNVLFRYDADQCTTEGCGSRYTVPVEHEHPLTPVTVLVVRREVPGA